MLTYVHFKCFRQLRDTRLDFPKGLPIVLIGPNATGKSSVLEGLDLMARASAPQGLSEALQLRGGLDMVRTKGTSLPMSIELGLDWGPGLPTEPDGGPVVYRFALLPEGGGAFTVQHESIDIYKHGPDAKPLTVLSRRGQQATLHNASTAKNDVVNVTPWDLAVTTVRQPEHYPTLANVRKALERIHVHASFNTAPAWTGDLQQGVGPRQSMLLSRAEHLDTRASNLVSRLYHIQQDDPNAWDDLLHQFRAEFPQVTRLDFPADAAGGRIALGYRDARFGTEKFFAQQMSDGMLSFLSLLAAMHAPAEPMVLGVDEPETHVHPSALRRVVHLMERTARTHAVVLATHSNAVLDHLSEPAQCVRTCESTGKGVELRRLPKDSLEAWREHYTLSEQRSRGLLDSSNADQDPAG